MKSSIRLFLVLAAPLMALTSVRADEAAPAAAPGAHPRLEKMREQRLQQLDQKLKLTPEQKTQITALWDKAEQNARAARTEAADAAKADRRADRRAAMKAVRQEVRGVLTPEQQAIFDKMPQDRRAGGAHEPAGEPK